MKTNGIVTVSYLYWIIDNRVWVTDTIDFAKGVFIWVVFFFFKYKAKQVFYETGKIRDFL